MPDGEQMVNCLLLMSGLTVFAFAIIAIINATDNRTPEQRERDQRAAGKKQWCEHKGGPCSRINNHKRPYRYCTLKCSHYMMTSRGLVAKKFYKDVYGDK